MRVAHLSSVHTRYDIRVFLKECCSLALHGFQTNFIVADGNGDELKNGVNIIDVGKYSGRIKRMIYSTQKIYNAAKIINADIYHLHDPELIPIGLKLRKLGKTVIFDAHEDLPKQILTKPYLHKTIRKPLSKSISLYEKASLKKFSGIITSTSSIADKFKLINKNVVNINNYPILNELFDDSIESNANKSIFAFVGGITSIRGITETLDAIDYTLPECNISFAGEFSPIAFKNQCLDHRNFNSINYLGQLGRTEVKRLLNDSLAGLVLYSPVPNHIDAQPNKLFEYMSAGIAVIGSHFPLWKDIIENYSCGICVDPTDPKQIADAINFLQQNPEIAKEMGARGREAVISTFNWESEQQKLISFYNKLI